MWATRRTACVSNSVFVCAICTRSTAAVLCATEAQRALTAGRVRGDDQGSVAGTQHLLASACVWLKARRAYACCCAGTRRKECVSVGGARRTLAVSAFGLVGAYRTSSALAASAVIASATWALCDMLQAPLAAERAGGGALRAECASAVVEVVGGAQVHSVATCCDLVPSWCSA